MKNFNIFPKLNQLIGLIVLILLGAILVMEYFNKNIETQQNKNLEVLEKKISQNEIEKDEKKNFQESVNDTQADEENFSQDENLYSIDYVIDGDTYVVWGNGVKEKVRVLGIDTPEKKGGFRVEGCFGDHASEYAKNALDGKKISLLLPKRQDSQDQYGRLLRYVFLDGKDFGAHLIENGYASAYKKFPHERKNMYEALEKTAQKNKIGMWNPENCEYWGQDNLLN